jgi:hypothetical protein
MGITESWHDGYATVPAPVASFACNAFDVHGNFGGSAGHARSAYRLNVGTGGLAWWE